MHPASLDHVPQSHSNLPDILTVEQAASYLHMHPVTLRCKVAAGEIPGSKVGKRWLFVRIDLESYVRANYVSRALQGDLSEKSICRSTSVRIHRSGGSNLAATEAEYRKVLGLMTG